MNFLIDILHNPVLISAITGWFVAQLLKILREIARGEFTLSRLRGGGGMPSAHSATVMGLTTAAAITYGGRSFEFAMALFFAIIVMYDAMGVRYETGQEAKALNRLHRERLEDPENSPGEPLLEKPLDEKMGHTFPEIAAGVVIGILAGMLVCHFL